ncbi:2-amino-4-hydroxy-6-hydroxymethyldihydropteridine diphosphokinase [Phocaeicola sp.]|nr:2-amino-4-hydroxy-6-hydroxymethyldihydropteridine diphosphokinase [Bacteroides sp.]
MNEHQCLLCMGSNTDRSARLSEAREALSSAFPDIHFGELMETEAIGSGMRSPFSNQLAKFTTTLTPDSVHELFKKLEQRSGRTPEDKAAGIVKLDIDLLVVDDKVLKPEDMEREYIRRGLRILTLHDY